MAMKRGTAALAALAVLAHVRLRKLEESVGAGVAELLHAMQAASPATRREALRYYRRVAGYPQLDVRQYEEIRGVERHVASLGIEYTWLRPNFYMQTLTDISSEGKNTIVFPLPVDLLSSFMKRD